MRNKLLAFVIFALATFVPSVANANQSTTRQYCTPLNQINDGNTLDAVPVMANYNGILTCLPNYGDLFTDGPLYSPALTTSNASFNFTIPSNVWVVQGARVYTVNTNEIAASNVNQYYWLDVYGVWRSTTTNIQPSPLSSLEYTIQTNTSGITNVVLPAITTPTFLGGLVAPTVSSSAGMTFIINQNGTSYQFLSKATNTTLAQFNTTGSGQVGNGTISWDALGNVSVSNLLLANPLSIAQGGTGTATPQMIAGSGIAITGTFPNYTISAAGQNAQTAVSTNTTNIFTASNSFTQPLSVTSILASGALITSANAQPPVTLSNSASAELTYNGTGSGDASLTTGNNGSVTASFWRPAGLSSKILSDGTYVPGTTGTTYGPGAINLVGTLTTSTYASIGPTATPMIINGPFSATLPDIGNSSDGGINMGVASTSNFGLRLFSTASSSNITQVFQVLPSGIANFGANYGGSFQYNFNAPASVNGLIVGTNAVAYSDTDPGNYKALSVLGNVSTSGYFKTGSTFIYPYGITSAGTIYANNGIFAAAAGTSSIQLCPNNACPGGLVVTNSQTTILSGAQGGAAAALAVPNGDIYTARGNNSGVIFLGNSGTHYLFFDGTNYNIPNGNLIVGGTVTANSVMSAKYNIQNLQDPLDIVRKTNIVSYCYKYEKCATNQTDHIGFLADYTPASISVNHTAMDIGATAAVAVASVKELDAKIEEQEKEIDALKHNRPMPSHYRGFGERLHDFFFGT